MKSVLKHFIYILIIFSSLSISAQNVKLVKFDDVEKFMNRQTDTTYVINFWATWCNPCVHELPNFGKLDSTYHNQKIKVLLVSLDFPKEFNTKLIPFVSKKKIQTEVWLLNDPDYNAWIDKVDPSWSGSIPATLVLNNKLKMKKFNEKELNLEELNALVKPFMSQK